MAEIEALTELFDLFGESGYCTICQDELKDGDRVRTIRSCQHLFHAACLDPWLISKRNCPLCRTSILCSPSLEVIQDANQTIRGLYSAIQSRSGDSEVIGRILTHIDQLIQQTAIPPAPAPNTLDRVLLSYCLTHGIIKKYRVASHYDSHKQDIRVSIGLFNLDGLRPLPIECDTFTALCRSRLTYKNELGRRLELTDTALLNAPSVRQMKTRLSVNLGSLMPHWRI